MLSLQMRILMFFGSYVPLFFILGLKYLNIYGYWVFIPCIFTICCLFLVRPLLARYFNTINANFQTLQKVQRKDVDILAYMFTYIIPLIEINLSSTLTIVAISVLLLIIFSFYIRSNIFYNVNPIFNLFGYHIYEIEANDGCNYTMISKNVLNNNQRVNALQLEYGILIEP